MARNQANTGGDLSSLFAKESSKKTQQPEPSDNATVSTMDSVEAQRGTHASKASRRGGRRPNRPEPMEKNNSKKELGSLLDNLKSEEDEEEKISLDCHTLDSREMMGGPKKKIAGDRPKRRPQRRPDAV